MSDQVKLAAQVRSGRGKGPSRRLRASGRVPAVMYGLGIDPTAVDVDARELYHVLHTSAGANVLIRLVVDGEEHLTLPREVQRDPVKGDVRHVDFVAVRRDQKVRVEIPIELLGVDDVQAPGVVAHVLHSLPMRVSPLEIPEHITIEVGDMQIGDMRRVEDLVLPEGVELDIDLDETVVTVNAPTLAELPEEEAAAEGEEAEGEAAEGEEQAESEGGES